MNALRFPLLVASVLAAVSFAVARPVSFPPYQNLLDKADLVVIATPTATADTRERIDLPGISVARADNSRGGLPVVGVETKFHVSAVLKGEGTLRDFVLHHYREAAKSERSVPNAAMLVAFDPSKPGSYLLFLVREPDGRYAPLDQTDPALICVQRLATNTRDVEKPPEL